jgi:hypothetical protein
MVNMSPWLFSALIILSVQPSVAADDFVYKSADSLSKELFDATKPVAPRADLVSSNVLESGQVGAVLSTPPLPIPNLTMSFTLNSALDDELTRYYSEIAQEILKNMPRKVSLHGDQASLLMGSRKFDKLNVIAYLPNPVKNEYSDPLLKDIRAFSVDFEVPDMLMAKRIMDDNEGRVSLQKPIVVHKGRYEEFLRRVGSIKAGGEIASIQDETLLSHKNTSSNEFLNSTAIAELKKPTPVKAAVDVKEKLQPPLEKIKKKSKPAPRKSIVLSDSRLTYEADYSGPEKGLDALVSKFSKIKNIKNLHFVGSAQKSFISDSSSVFNARVKRMLSVLDDGGVDVSSLHVSSIILKSQNDKPQYIKIEAIGDE